MDFDAIIFPIGYFCIFSLYNSVSIKTSIPAKQFSIPFNRPVFSYLNDSLEKYTRSDCSNHFLLPSYILYLIKNGKFFLFV